jgi:hypothetical protein
MYNNPERWLMTDFEKTLLDEVAALPKSRRADVLAFVRYLRISLMDENEIDLQYDRAVTDIRETAKRYNITQEDIETEIVAGRKFG